MSDIKAFPEIKYVAPQGMGSHVMAVEGGMDLRDYFASDAMKGLLSNPKLHEEILKMEQSWIYDSAYAIADKMMEIRNK